MEGIRLRIRRNRLGTFNIKINDDRFLSAANHYRLYGLVGGRVEFLVRYERRHVNKVSWRRLGDKLQAISPAKSGATPDDIKDGLQFTVVVRSGSCGWLHNHGACPEFLRSGASEGDCRSSGHAGSLRRVEVQLIGVDDADTAILPAGSFS